MQRIRQMGLLVAAVLSVFVLATMPVAADHGSDSTSGSSDTTTSTSGDSSSTTTNDSTETTTETEVETPEVHARVDSLKNEAKDLLKTKRDDHAQRTTEERQKACEAQANNINTRVSDYSAAAQRHLNVFTSILTKVQNFYTTKNLNVSTYSALLATAQAKQADAQTAVDALKALDTKIDCTQTDPAQTVAAMKQAVADARTALQAYRTAIKNVIVALQGASSAQDKTQSTTGGNQ